MADWDQHRRNQINTAMRESAKATARLQGMKLGVFLDPPRAAVGHMPFRGHRTQAEVFAAMTAGERRRYLERA